MLSQGRGHSRLEIASATELHTIPPRERPLRDGECHGCRRRGLWHRCRLGKGGRGSRGEGSGNGTQSLCLASTRPRHASPTQQYIRFVPPSFFAPQSSVGLIRACRQHRIQYTSEDIKHTRLGDATPPRPRTAFCTCFVLGGSGIHYGDSTWFCRSVMAGPLPPPLAL